jgi:hypothetical protein
MWRWSFDLIISFCPQILTLITFIEPTFYNEVLRLNILNSLNHPFCKEDVYWELRGMLWWQEPKVSLGSSLRFARVLVLPWNYANTKLTCWTPMVPYGPLWSPSSCKNQPRCNPSLFMQFVFRGCRLHMHCVLSTMQISCWFETVWFRRVKIEKLMCGGGGGPDSWPMLGSSLLFTKTTSG